MPALFMLNRTARAVPALQLLQRLQSRAPETIEQQICSDCYCLCRLILDEQSRAKSGNQVRSIETQTRVIALSLRIRPSELPTRLKSQRTDTNFR
jgi:hypothetical protein